MNDFLKMDIFFGVATAAALILTALAAIALMYAIRLLRTLARISEEVEEEAKALRQDLDDARKETKRKASAYIAFIEKAVKRLLGRKRKKAS